MAQKRLSRRPAAMSPGEALERFYERITETGCQIWMRCTNAAGYGRIGIGNKFFLAHRVAYGLASGGIPDAMFVLHRCDVPPCVNPSHLFLGTDADNKADMVAKARQQRGEKHAHAVLTDEQVIAIRADTRPQHVIAADYRVSQSQVSFIQRDEEWRHLPAMNAKRTQLGRIDNGNKVKGEAHPIARLTEDEVRAIRRSAAPPKRLAAEYGVSDTLIYRIRQRKAWAHVT